MIFFTSVRKGNFIRALCFNGLLLEAQERRLVKLEPDEKSGGYTVRAVE